MTADPPLPALLSRLLVAFTIEFDDEYEHRSPHRTTWGPAAGSRGGPWLVSQVMWANFLQFVGAPGVPLREVDDLARITNLAGLEWWGYVVVEPEPAAGRPAAPRRDWVVRPTPAGRRAQEVWAPLAGVIEDRWRGRFGAGQITAVRDALQALVAQLDVELPPYLPVVRHELFADTAQFRRRAPAAGAGPGVDLSVLRRALLALTGPGDGAQSGLAQGLKPYPAGWRAHRPFSRQTTAVLKDPGGALPRYPMVLHRGGWPDGS